MLLLRYYQILDLHKLIYNLDFCDFIRQNIQVEIGTFHPETLYSFLVNIKEIRNICAHNNRIIGYRCHQDVKCWEILHSTYNIEDRRSVYSVFMSLKCFISCTEYAVLHNTIIKKMTVLSKQLKTIHVNNILLELGFPENWYKEEKKIKH